LILCDFFLSIFSLFSFSFYSLLFFFYSMSQSLLRLFQINYFKSFSSLLRIILSIRSSSTSDIDIIPSSSIFKRETYWLLILLLSRFIKRDEAYVGAPLNGSYGKYGTIWWFSFKLDSPGCFCSSPSSRLSWLSSSPFISVSILASLYSKRFAFSTVILWISSS